MLRIFAHQVALAVAFHLTAALVRVCAGIGGTGIGSSDDSAHQVGDDLRELGTRAVLPRDVADLCRQIRRHTWYRPAWPHQETFPRLEPAERALRDVIAQAQAQALAAAPTRNGLNIGVTGCLKASDPGTHVCQFHPRQQQPPHLRPPTPDFSGSLTQQRGTETAPPEHLGTDRKLARGRNSSASAASGTTTRR